MYPDTQGSARATKRGKEIPNFFVATHLAAVEFWWQSQRTPTRRPVGKALRHAWNLRVLSSPSRTQQPSRHRGRTFDSHEDG
jgi:hypothetical protein